MKRYINSVLGLILGLGALLWAATATAQEVSLKAQFQSSTMKIGEQLSLDLYAEIEPGQQITFPDLSADSAYRKLELLQLGPIDSAAIEGNKLRLHQRIVFTAWEPGDFAFPAPKFGVLREGRMLEFQANDLFLKVSVPQVDTAQAIQDIIAPIDTPFNFEEFLDIYLPWILGGLVLIGLIVLLVIYLRNREEKPHTVLHRPKIPIHEQARNALRELAEEKLWQSGQYKAYHSRLVDILKNYIEQRYSLSVLELTSDETLRLLALSASKHAEAHAGLKGLFQVADLTKFAKYEPIGSENEESMRLASQYIDATWQPTADEVPTTPSPSPVTVKPEDTTK